MKGDFPTVNRRYESIHPFPLPARRLSPAPVPSRPAAPTPAGRTLPALNARGRPVGEGRPSSATNPARVAAVGGRFWHGVAFAALCSLPLWALVIGIACLIDWAAVGAFLAVTEITGSGGVR